MGKTVVTAGLVAFFKERGKRVGVMKPVESGVDPDCCSAANSDALFLMEVSECGDALSEVSPIRLKPAASPYQAALMENTQIDIAPIFDAYATLSQRHDVLLIEGVGGLMVPIRRDYLVLNLIRDLGLPLIIVSRSTLGTLNHTLLTVETARREGLDIAGIVMNNPRGLEKNAIEEDQGRLISELSGVAVLGEMPFIDPVAPESFNADLAGRMESRLDVDKLFGKL